MRPYRFCPDCGGALSHPAGGGGARCPSCGRSWYRHSAPAVGAAIVWDGRALVTVRGREPEKGRIDVPGGFLEADEHPLEGLRREVREELGVEVEVSLEGWIAMGILHYGSDHEPVLALGFLARITAGEPCPGDDVADVRWVAADELDALDFAWEHDREMVRTALQGEVRIAR